MSGPEEIALLLLTELPDSNHDLAMQLLDSFPQFRELPTELRLRIFKTMFPKSQHIHFGVLQPQPLKIPGKTRSKQYSSIAKLYSNEQYRCHEIAQSRALPITLYINHESREETLKTYKAVDLRPDSRYYCGATKLFCFSPSRDTAYFCRTPRKQWQYAIFWELLEERVPGLLDIIQEVEIKDVVLRKMVVDEAYLWKPESEKEKEKVKNFPNYMANIIRRFPGLKKLVLTLVMDDEGLNMDDNGKERAAKLVGDYLEENKDVWGGTAPEISIKDWEKVKP